MTDALFAVDVPNRRIRGLLIPYGELSAPNISGTEPVMFSAGTVQLPTDPSIITLNAGHDQLEPRGRAVTLDEQPEGVVAEFEIARTPEGDQLLADAQAEPRPRLSAELRGLVRRGQSAVSSALRGAAIVPRGAFQSAALFAALDPIEEQPDEDDETTDEAPAETETTEATEAEEPNQEEDMTAAAATVPAGLNAPTPKKDALTADALFSALASYARTKDRSVMEPFGESGADALFAISTIQHAGPTTLTIGADTQVPQFVNEIWTRRKYERKYIPLGSQESLTSMKVQGWKWDPAAEPVVAAYSGNTAEIPSGAVDTLPVSADAVRLAGGHRLERRYIDFGDQTVYQSYLGKMAESYARVSDLAWLAAAVAGATASNSSAATVPTGIAKGLGCIVDGALAVIASENTPSFAIVHPTLWRDIVLTGNKDVLGYLDASLGLETGSLANFKIIPGAVAANKVLVGAKEAFTFYELPGVPIRVEGIAPHQGAIDPALFGYYATLVNNSAALQLVTSVA